MRDVAEVVGVSPSLVSYWETGKRNPSAELLAAWKGALVYLERVAEKRKWEAKHAKRMD